ncbi:MAG TPA: CDGSH iron-sulfur domain-containing protein [Miltoncostaeaceae bacterium]|nr:CDGSH iron-sulfur domain-containing protein [Miltoncostaeaceae bacterium]
MSAAHRPTEIRAYPDGPLLVRGPFVLHDEDGAPVVVRRRTVALCRCGRSRSLPLCDGTHRPAGFTTARAPSAAGGTASPRGA